MVINLDLSVIYIIICFLIILWVARRSIFRPLDRILDERQELISSSEQFAKSTIEKVDSAISDYNKQIAAARSEGFSTRQELKTEGFEEQREVTEQARSEAAEMLAEANQRIEKDLAAAREFLEEESNEIAEKIIATVIGRGQ